VPPCFPAQSSIFNVHTEHLPSPGLFFKKSRASLNLNVQSKLKIPLETSAPNFSQFPGATYAQK
jgi:hypothetical protein